MNDIQMPIYAFPIHPDVDIFLDKTWCGMTLRDYFAAKAMQGMLSENSGIRYPTDELVDFAYKVADAMMKAREL
jgi:hypothetical protein